MKRILVGFFRHLRREINGCIRYKVPAIFHRIISTKVKYKGFSKQDEETFDVFVNKHLDHPAKRQALSWLATDTLLDGGFSLLDVGCGPGVLPHMILCDPLLRDRITYVGVDQSKNAIQYCKNKLPKEYTAICQDVLIDALPKGKFDVIMINEVIEHIPYYDQLISAAIAKRPKIFILTTFAAIPEYKRDRLLWRSDLKCYMNSYSFKKLFLYLRNKIACPILICDYGTTDFNRYWFPKKASVVWYIRLGAEKPSE